MKCHVFYLDNQQTNYTTFKVYNAVLYYKYFNNLGMSAIELESNTPEYNLLILLPDFHTDLVTAAASLRFAPKLRLLRKQLKPKRVQATIPDFQLNGVMFLTNDLQNMGIGDIFEPNRADFRPMTDEKSTYVRHIEQSIDIDIRTHPINPLRRTNGAQTQPIQISVNHPFMFFIVDRDLDVAVISGRILNPLNRLQWKNDKHLLNVCNQFDDTLIDEHIVNLNFKKTYDSISENIDYDDIGKENTDNVNETLVSSNQCKSEISTNYHWDEDDNDFFASISTQEILDQKVQVNNNFPSISKLPVNK
uniref:Serpin domain-containing protein n=1 Tax=Glossina austeni TaxID=7395 RepID=A0A1A9V0R5_GLOAU